mgnify:FL=1
MSNYLYNNKYYTTEEVEKIASDKGFTLDQFVNSIPELQAIDITWDDVSGSENIDKWNALSRDQKRNLAKIKQAEQKANQLQVDEKEDISKIETLTSNLGLGFVEFAQGVQRQSEAFTLGTMQLLMPGEETAEQKIAMLKTIRNTNF